MLIDKIAKEMELEQFINHLEKDIGSVISFVQYGQSYSCPSQIGLSDIGYIENMFIMMKMENYNMQTLHI